MKTLKLSFTIASLLLSTFLFSHKNFTKAKLFGETPAKTIVIKNLGADDTNTFFSNSKIYSFEVYKIGDVKAVLELLKKDKNIETCSASNPIGDFTPIQLSLKNTKNKAWFINLFKAAGLNNIRINQKDVMPVDKM